MTRRTVGNRRRTGATLLIVLVLVTIASILLVAYLGMVQSERTTTQNYSGELSADQVARGGLDRLVGDLDQEIAAGSTAIPGPTATSPTYYQDTNALTMVPARYNDTGTNYINVIRVSSSNSTNYQAAYPPTIYTGQVPVNLAVASSTTNPSPDGRYLSAARWQAPQLLLPNETNAATMPVPDWILMTRSGPTNAFGLTFGSTGNTLNNRDASNPNYVVGRYAYIVYNEGGLLDATVAGAPSSGAGAPTADDVGNRGSLAMALLTNSVLTPSQMITLASWRNATNDASESAYTNYVYTTQATNGFLQVQPGDNTFLSRQDLIAYANFAGMTSALPYLGTFNRSLNAPAYTPATPNATNSDLLTLRFANGGTINSGGTLLQSRTVQAGDFLLTSRFPLSRLSWVGYNALANGASAIDVWRAFGLVYDTVNNDWVYVSGSGTSLPNASAVKTSIETLTQVSQESPPRDPDFFELLQAGILNGSLGQTAGPQFTFTGSSVYLYGGSGDTSGYDSVQPYQIIQIGVNIIDQAQADSFPTAIRFGPDPRDQFVNVKTGLSDAAFVGPRTFYGVKNLPYISRIVDTFARWVTPPLPLKNGDKLTSNSPFPGQVYRQPYVGCWQQIELWNPHQTNAATPVPASSLYPFALRVAASGKIHGEVYSRETPSSANEFIEDTCPPGVTLASGPTETLWAYTTTFIQLSSAGTQDFSEPKMIPTSDVTAANCTTNCVQTGLLTTGSGANGASATPTPFVGLYVGSAYAPDYFYCATNTTPTGGKGFWPPVTATTTNDPACVSYNDARIDPDDPAGSANAGTTYEMEYQDTNNGTWRPYGVVKNQSLTADTVMPFSSLPSNPNSTWTIINSDAAARFSQGIDPRTDRFSMSKSRESDTIANGAFPNPVDTPPNFDSTIRPLTPVSGYSSDGCIPYSNASGTSWLGNSSASTPVVPPTVPQSYYYLGGLMENTTNSSTYYQDPDGVQRRGDSAYDISGGEDGHPGIGNGSFTDSINLARPVILNRPFRSVGELGYVGRDLPWKTLDFFTKQSGDAGLLDLFSVSDANVVAGTIDLNTRNAQALAEVLGGAAINPNYAAATDSLASPITSTQATTLANDFITATTTLPLRSRAEMVTTALDPNTGETALTTDGYTAQSSKIQREAAIRALSEVGNARTWNLLIDIIAQSGRYPQTLGPNSSYNSFTPDGEKRYWLHIAIDRYTGRVVDRFLEPVQE
jgi:hypothetical protein